MSESLLITMAFECSCSHGVTLDIPSALAGVNGSGGRRELGQWCVCFNGTSSDL